MFVVLINKKVPKIERLYWVMKIFHFTQSTKSSHGCRPLTATDTQHANRNHTQHSCTLQQVYLLSDLHPSSTLPHSYLFNMLKSWNGHNLIGGWRKDLPISVQNWTLPKGSSPSLKIVLQKKFKIWILPFNITAQSLIFLNLTNSHGFYLIDLLRLSRYIERLFQVMFLFTLSPFPSHVFVYPAIVSLPLTRINYQSNTFLLPHIWKEISI